MYIFDFYFLKSSYFGELFFQCDEILTRPKISFPKNHLKIYLFEALRIDEIRICEERTYLFSWERK